MYVKTIIPVNQEIVDVFVSQKYTNEENECFVFDAVRAGNSRTYVQLCQVPTLMWVLFRKTKVIEGSTTLVSRQQRLDDSLFSEGKLQLYKVIGDRFVSPGGLLATKVGLSFG